MIVTWLMKPEINAAEVDSILAIVKEDMDTG
jgi:hypothetical protein